MSTPTPTRPAPHASPLKAPFGLPVLRSEDYRLITGAAEFVGDMHVENALHMTLVTSPVAHATIVDIDTAEARAAPGVVAVITNAELDVAPVPPWLPNADQRMTRSLLADRVVRFVGEPVAAVLATSSAQAADAVPLVKFEFELLPPVVEPARAATDETVLFPQAGTNTCFEIPREEPDDPDLFARCDVRVEVDIAHQRIAACPIEPRAGVAVCDDETGLTYWAAAAEPHGMRERLSVVLGIDESRIRVICPDVGGAFGAKGGDYLEEMLVGVLARKLGRPIRWAETRTESMIGMYHGRGMSQRVELGGLRDGTILAYKIDVLQDAGAYPTWAPMLTNRARVLASGAYAVPRIEATGRAVVTTTTPVGTVRGAGRPEANIAIERAIDLFAAELGIDPAVVRRRNLIAPASLPYTTATGSTYDSGDYPELLRRILEAGRYEELRDEQRARRAADDPMLLGIGIGMFVEISDTAPVGEYTRLLLTGEGGALLFTGAAAQGQGHRTVLAQVVAGMLGMAFEDVSVRQGDTAEVPVGVGTFGSRTAQAAGSAAYRAAGELLARAREVASRMLDADEGEFLVDAGRGLSTTDGRSVSWRELAQSCMAEGVKLEVEHRPGGQYGSAWPSGVVLAAVDIDSETGVVSVRSLVACDDVGVVLNPLIVDGQVQGGLALGVAHALVEEFRYDEDGSPATTNFGDYPVITVDLVPRAQLGHIVSPAPDNDLGAKGVGEAGTVGCPAAILNAVADALGPLGVRHVSPPATPERVLTAIEEARRNGG